MDVPPLRLTRQHILDEAAAFDLAADAAEKLSAGFFRKGARTGDRALLAAAQDLSRDERRMRAEAAALRYWADQGGPAPAPPEPLA